MMRARGARYARVRGGAGRGARRRAVGAATDEPVAIDLGRWRRRTGIEVAPW